MAQCSPKMWRKKKITETVKYDELDMENLGKDAIARIPEDDGPHTSKLDGSEAPHFTTVADPTSVVNQPSSLGNVDGRFNLSARQTGKPFKKLSRQMKYSGGEDFAGAVSNVGIGEAVKKDIDKGEYDYEGDMAKTQLRGIIHHAQMMHDMLKDDTNLPEWVQNKITLAEDYITTAVHYMDSKMNEGYTDPYAAKKAAEMRKKKADLIAAAKKEYEESKEAKGKINLRTFMRKNRYQKPRRSGKASISPMSENLSLAESEIKKGDIVYPKTGPHKGHPHEVIHSFGDGRYNIKPKGLSPKQNQYRLGAATAHKKDLSTKNLSEGEVKKANKASSREYMRQLGTGLRYKMKSSMGPHAKYMHDDNATGDVARGRAVNRSIRRSDLLQQKRSIEGIVKGLHGERKLRMQWGTKKENLPSFLQKIGSNFRTADVAKAKEQGRIPLKKKSVDESYDEPIVLGSNWRDKTKDMKRNTKIHIKNELLKKLAKKKKRRVQSEQAVSTLSKGAKLIKGIGSMFHPRVLFGPAAQTLDFFLNPTPLNASGSTPPKTPEEIAQRQQALRDWQMRQKQKGSVSGVGPRESIDDSIFIGTTVEYLNKKKN